MDFKKIKLKQSKGIFCLSFDFELLYGRSIEEKKLFINKAHKVNLIIPQLITILEKNKIGATWAIVGKLNNNKLTKLISKTKYQEIATHTFSHKYFNLISKSDCEKEIIKGVQSLKKYQEINSIVFPKNQVKHLDLLEKHKIYSFRDKNIINNKILQLVDLYFHFPITSNLVTINTLTSTNGTFYFVSGRGFRKFISKNIRYSRAVNGINLAIKRKKVFHMWTHPIDFADDTEKLLNDFEKTIKYVKEKKDNNELEVLTMRQLIQYSQTLVQ